MKTTTKEVDPLTRTIARKEGIIKRWAEKQKQERALAEEECERIQKQINRERVLLDALKRGALKP